MSSNSELIDLFFRELKQYNSTNFKSIEKADLNNEDSKVFKSCSSVVTRYFIFKERHPEIPEPDMNRLYYKLRIDMIARYFSEYPAADISDLIPFQRELIRFTEGEKEKSSITS